MSLMKIKEVGQVLRISVSTVRKLIASDELKAVRIGKSVRIDASELALYLKGITTQSPAAAV